MKVLGWVRQVVAWCVIVAVLMVLAVAVLIPRISGATPYTVLTGSMRPSYPPGTLVVMKPVAPKKVREGDVVVVQLKSGKGGYVTHRVAEVQHRLDGKLRFVTKGDANNAPDADERLPEQIRGTLWYAVPYLGYVNNAMTGRQRQTAVFVVAAVLIGYAMFMFGGAVMDRRTTPGKRRKED